MSCNTVIMICYVNAPRSEKVQKDIYFFVNFITVYQVLTKLILKLFSELIILVKIIGFRLLSDGFFLPSAPLR